MNHCEDFGSEKLLRSILRNIYLYIHNDIYIYMFHGDIGLGFQKKDPLLYSTVVDLLEFPGHTAACACSSSPDFPLAKPSAYGSERTRCHDRSGGG